MDDYLVGKLELKRSINKTKKLKEKLLKGHIFQELTLDEKIKGKDIKTKVKNIRDEEMYDLQLIDIHFIKKNLFLSQDLNSQKARPLNKSFKQNTIIKHNPLINKSENDKKQLEIFPYISLPKNKKIKSSEIINLTENNTENNLEKFNFNDIKGILNDNYKKLFMTKVDNKKNYKNDFKTYSQNFFDSTQKNVSKNEDNNRMEIGHYLSNKKNKFLKNNNVLNISKYYAKNNNITEDKVQDTMINNNKYKTYSKENTNHYKNSFNDIVDKDDNSIFKLMKKNKKLRKFIHEKKIRKKQFNYFLNNVNNNKNSFNKQILNKNIINNILNKNDYSTPNRNNNFKQIYIDNYKKNERIKTLDINREKINLNIDNNVNINSINTNLNTITRNLNVNLNIINPKLNTNLNNNLNENNQINYKQLLRDIEIKTNLLKNIKNKEKFKRYFFSLIINNLEKDLNKNYEDLNNTFKSQKIKVAKMKKKCIDILEEYDKKINFNLEEFIKEFEREDLGIKFIQFFNYLLMILANYDKTIIPNTFTIKKETKNQSEIVKYSNVKKKHNEFMNLLDKQFNEGKNINKLLQKYLLKRKEEVEKNNKK